MQAAGNTKGRHGAAPSKNALARVRYFALGILCSIFTLAVAKSNFVGLRYREPIHRSIRELMLSYFEPYYNLEGHKALRSYSRTLDLSAFDDLAWEDRDEAVETIVARLEASRHYTLLSPPMIANLRKVDERSFQAGMMGAVDAGLYKPWEH